MGAGGCVESHMQDQSKMHAQKSPETILSLDLGLTSRVSASLAKLILPYTKVPEVNLQRLRDVWEFYLLVSLFCLFIFALFV